MGNCLKAHLNETFIIAFIIWKTVALIQHLINIYTGALSDEQATEEQTDMLTTDKDVDGVFLTSATDRHSSWQLPLMNGQPSTWHLRLHVFLKSFSCLKSMIDCSHSDYLFTCLHVEACACIILPPNMTTKVCKCNSSVKTLELKQNV